MKLEPTYLDQLNSCFIRGDLEKLKELVEGGIGIRLELMLQEACYWNHLDMIQYLIGLGADPHFANDFAIRSTKEPGRGTEILGYLNRLITKEKLEGI